MKNLNFPGLPRVLIIDDEEGVREGLKSLLNVEGVSVDTASTAEDGVCHLQKKPFDLVFLDLNLPGADGLSMMSKLRRGTPPADIVVLTGYGTVANTVEAMRKGATDVIEKPFSHDRILAVMRRIVVFRGESLDSFAAFSAHGTAFLQAGPEVDEVFFLGGIEKKRIIDTFKPHIFFDDQIQHIEGVAGAAPDPQDEQPPPPLSSAEQELHPPVYCLTVELIDNLSSFREIGIRIPRRLTHRLNPAACASS